MCPAPNNAIFSFLSCKFFRCGAVQHRNESAGGGAGADTAFQGCDVGLVALEIAFENRVVHFDGGLDQAVPVVLGLLFQLGRNLDRLEFGAERLVLPEDRSADPDSTCRKA